MIVPQSFEDGLLRTDEIEDIAAHVNGLPYTADGSLAVSLEGTVNHVSGGIPFDVNGRVCVGEGDPAWYLRGLAVTSAGRLCVAFSGDAVLHIGGLPATAAGAILANLNAAATFALDFEQDDYFGFSPAFAHTRATASSLVQQFDGSFVQMLANEWGREGGRRVENLAPNTGWGDAVSKAAGETGGAPTGYGMGATTGAHTAHGDGSVTFACSTQRRFFQESTSQTFATGDVVFIVVEIVAIGQSTNLGQIVGRQGTAIFTASSPWTNVDAPGVYWYKFTCTSGGTMQARYGMGAASDQTGTVRLQKPRIQKGRPGQTEPDPEYVSRGVLSAPYHGWGVDGVAWFNTDEEGADLTSASSGYPVRAAGIVRRPAVTNLWPRANPTLANVTNVGVTDAGPIAGLPNAIGYADNAALRYFNLPLQLTGSHVVQALVKMDDGGVPVHGASAAAGFDFTLVGENAWISAGGTDHLGGNLYRVWGTRTMTGVNTTSGLYKQTTHSARGFKVLLFQVHAGTKPLPFVLTNGASATADADVITPDKDEIGYSAAGGVWVVEHTPAKAISADAGEQVLLDLYTSANERARVYNPSSNLGVEVVDDSVSQWSANDADANWVAGTQQRVAARFVADDGSLVTDGTEHLTDASMTVPTVTSINLGGLAASKYSGTIERIAYYAEDV